MWASSSNSKCLSITSFESRSDQQTVEAPVQERNLKITITISVLYVSLTLPRSAFAARHDNGLKLSQGVGGGRDGGAGVKVSGLDI